MPTTVRDNTSLKRYELEVDGATAFVTYVRSAGVATFLHMEVPHELSGRGIGSALAQESLELARAQGYKVIPECPFITAYIRKHPEFLDLVVASPSDRL